MTKCPKRQIPSQDSISDLETLTNLIFYREAAEIKEMTDLLKQKIMTEGKPFFDVWMYEASDNIQNLAMAFGERICLESALNKLALASDPQLKGVLTKIIRLHAMSLVKENMPFYLTNQIVNAKAAKELEIDF